MSLLGRGLLHTTQRLRRLNTMQVFDEIRLTPFLPQSEILARQFQQLSELLADAEAHVPYYRQMFRNHGISSRDIRSMEDFARLPVLTKSIIRERHKELLRDDISKDKLLEFKSGGSTGVPLRFYRDRSILQTVEAALFRNLAQCGWKPGEMVAYFWGWSDRLNAMSRLGFEVRQHLRRRYQFDPFNSGPREMDQWMAKWSRIRPTVIFGYASTIARFADHVEQRGKLLPPLRGVFTTAEKLYPPQRQLISRVFNCRVYDCYGSSEIHNIASECPHGRMHINSDYVVLEVDASAAEPGAPTPLIVTSLTDRVMPFIRYRNEDCGALLNETCDCGNNFPLMDLKVARISDNFVLPDGRVVHGEFFTHLMYRSDGIEMFQFHQTAPDKITLWIVPRSGQSEAVERTIRSVAAQIRQLDSRITLSVQQTEAIPLTSAGKHRFTRSDVSAVNTTTMAQ